MFECLIHMPLQIECPHYLPPIESTKISRKEHKQRVREVEHSSFTPIVLSLTGGLGNAATTCYKKLASLLSVKRGQHYNTTMSWLRCRLSFSLLRSSIMCIRGARSSQGHPIKLDVLPMDLL